MELQGALFFGTGEKMLSVVETELRRETSCVILDLRRLTEIDSTGAKVLLELKANLTQRNIELLLAAPGNTIAVARLENFGVLSSIGDANLVLDVDRGIQRAEDDLLRTQPRLHDSEMHLAQVGVFAGFNAIDLKTIEPYLKRASLLSSWSGSLSGERGWRRSTDRYERDRQRLSANARHKYTLGLSPKAPFLASLLFLTKACAQRRSSPTRSLHAVR